MNYLKFLLKNPGFAQRKWREITGYQLYLKPLEQRNRLNDVELTSLNNIAIFSSPRSGGTFLAQTLTTLTDACLAYEPLFRGKMKEFDALGFNYEQYIPENANWLAAEKFFIDLFRRHILSPKVYYYNEFSRIKDKDTYLFKFISGNLLMPWIAQNFPVKAIYLVRHPCAVVSSQLRHPGWSWADEIKKYQFPVSKYKDIYTKYKKPLSHVNGATELLTAIWALANTQILNNTANERWLKVYYEDLVLDPVHEFSRIFNYLKYDEIELNKKILENPSLSYKGDKEKFNREGLITKWQKNLSGEQIERIISIINDFDISIYNKDPIPAKH
jgi:hypothetical protein